MVLSARFYDCKITTGNGFTFERKVLANSEEEAFDKAYTKFSNDFKLDTVEVKEYV